MKTNTPHGILDYSEAEVLYEASKYNYDRLRVEAKSNYLKAIMRSLGYNMTPDVMLAILADPKHKMLIAGAGAGKTSTMDVQIAMIKMLHKVRTGHHFPGNKILYLSFSEASVKNIKYKHQTAMSKINKSGFVTDKADVTTWLSEDISCNTLHSFGNAWFIEYRKFFGFEELTLITDENELATILENAMTRVANKFEVPQVDAKRVLRLIHRCTESLIDLNSNKIYDIDSSFPIIPSTLEVIARTFKVVKKNRKIYDYTDMVSYLLQLTETNEEFMKRTQINHPYIFVDECQDLNPILIKIISNLSKYCRIVMVADEDQSIYRFRGAEPMYLQQFTEMFGDSAVFVMSYNRRCRQLICEAALNIIELNDIRFEKEIRAMKPGGFIGLEGYSTETEQLDRLVSHLKSKDSVSLQKVGIGVRENLHTGAITRRLKQEGIPYSIIKGNHDIEHPLYDVIVNVFILLLEPYNPNVKSHLNKVTPATFNEIDNALKNSITNSRDPMKASEHFIDIDWGSLETKKDFRTSLENLHLLSKHVHKDSTKNYFDMLFKVIRAYYWDFMLEMTKEKNPKKYPYDLLATEEVYNYFNGIYNAKEMIEKLAKDRQEARTISDLGLGVKIGTLHSYKGLEFEEMHLLYMNSTIFPTNEDYGDISDEAIQGLYEGENSLAYVGYTRAEEKLYLHYDMNDPSPYVLRTKEFLSHYKETPIVMNYIPLTIGKIKPVPRDPNKVVEEVKPVVKSESEVVGTSVLSEFTRKKEEVAPAEIMPKIEIDIAKVAEKVKEEEKTVIMETPKDVIVGSVKPNNDGVAEKKSSVTSFLNKFKI